MIGWYRIPLYLLENMANFITGGKNGREKRKCERKKDEGCEGEFEILRDNKWEGCHEELKLVCCMVSGPPLQCTVFYQIFGHLRHFLKFRLLYNELFLSDSQCCGSGSGIRDPVPFCPPDPG